ncbi:hypothetical protein [Streptomyces sp. NPDC005303]|uniref:hypothetical protein n=1 Tax=Streptomyces sp. NPDC005303 TaxID=3155713 RepID=UPI0033BC16EE
MSWANGAGGRGPERARVGHQGEGARLARIKTDRDQDNVLRLNQKCASRVPGTGAARKTTSAHGDDPHRPGRAVVDARHGRPSRATAIEPACSLRA